MSEFLTELREQLLDGLERHERAPRWRRGLPRQRAWRPAGRRLAAVAVAVTAAISLATVIANRSPEIEQGTTPQVAQLDGFLATGFLAGDDVLWVAEGDAGRLLRIDPQTGKVRARVIVGGLSSTVIAGAGALWILDWEGRLLKLDPDTNQVVKPLALEQTGGDVAFAAGAVWVIGDDGVLLRVDPDTVTVARRMPLGPDMRGDTCDCGTRGSHARAQTLAVADDTLWVAAGSNVVQLDANSGEILGRTTGPALTDERTRRVAADDSALWISTPNRPEVVRIDARTREATRIPIDGDAAAIAVVDGRIWVGTLPGTQGGTRVTVLEPDGSLATTVPVPGAPAQIAPAPGGGAWLTFGTTDLLYPAAVRLASRP